MKWKAGQIFGGGRNPTSIEVYKLNEKKLFNWRKVSHTCFKEPAVLASWVSLSLSHKTFHFWPFWSPNVRGFSSHHQVLSASPADFPANTSDTIHLRLWTQSPETVFRSDANHKCRVLPVLQCFWWSIITSEVPMTPSLGLINLLEQFTKLRGTLTLMFTSLLKDKDKGWASQVAHW